MTRWRPVGISGGGGTETPAISPHDPNLTLINCDMSGAYRSTDGGVNWEMIHWRQLTGCPFCAPVFHPAEADTIFAAFSYEAQLRISRDRGVTWAPLGEGLPGGLRRLATDGRNGSRMLAHAGGELYRSTDGGLRWQRCATLAGEPLGLHVDSAGPTERPACFAATAEGFHRSWDGGASWARAGAGLPAGRVAAFAAASNARGGGCMLYLWLEPPGGPGEIYRSSDRGSTWQKAADLPVTPAERDMPRFLLACDARPESLYAVKPAYSACDTVHRSDDAGATWRPVAFADKADPRYNMPENYISNYFLPRSLWGWSITAAAIDPRNPEHVLFSHYCSVFITRDGGRTWTAGEVRPAPASAAEPPASRRWISNGLVNTTTWHYYVDPFERQRHYIAYTDLGLLRSADGGESWGWSRQTGPNTYELAFDPEVPGRIWAAFSEVHDIPNNNIVTHDHRATGFGAVGYSEDFGQTWWDRNMSVPINDDRWYGKRPTEDYHQRRALPEAPVVSVVLDPRSPRDARRLFASVWEHGVFRSDDGGRTWTKGCDGPGAPGANVRTCRIRLHRDGSLFCLVTGKKRDGVLIPDGVGLYRSEDRGETWRKLTAGMDLRWLTDFDVDPADSRTAFLAACDDPGRNLAEGGLYKTADGGGHWRRVARKSAFHFGATIHPADGRRVYMTLTYNQARAEPLWLSRDGGETWQPFEDYPFCSAHRVHFDPGEPGCIYVTSFGGGVWKGPAEP